MDGTQDACAALSGFCDALRHVSERRPGVISASIKTDGAGAYVGVDFWAGLCQLGQLTGVRVVQHGTGEAYCGKSALDGHFGIAHQDTKRGVDSGQYAVRPSPLPSPSPSSSPSTLQSPSSSHRPADRSSQSPAVWCPVPCRVAPRPAPRLAHPPRSTLPPPPLSRSPLPRSARPATCTLPAPGCAPPPTPTSS